ncbi:STAS domain-containing protein [Streptomyces sp. NPDC056773]|uniref:STAS domain-containing protein n=1 Tax=unclassified Streptomyces TaxID=2593676 RepID=UPI00369FD2CA
MDDGGDDRSPEDPKLPSHTAVTVSYETPGTCVIAARGEFDLGTVAPLSDALAEAARSHSRVVLDASGIGFGDSSLLNLLLQVHRITELRIAAPRHQLRHLLAITGADTVLDVRDTVPSAVED